MDNIKIRCKICNNEIEGHPSKTVICGCSNIATIKNNRTITAIDLASIIMLNTIKNKNKDSLFSMEDIAWQEARRQRKVKKLNFEVR
jgi:hypothetical protein